MKVLVIGSGGREHALVVALSRSPSVKRVFCAPGNGGMIGDATPVPEIPVHDGEGIVAFAKRETIDLAVIGPEAPLVAGLADLLRDEGIAVFGPGRSGARLEGSKVFAKELMAKHDIPTASYHAFTQVAEALDYVRGNNYYPIVIKVDGLAAGKGVVICEDEPAATKALHELMTEKRFGEAGDRIVIEEFLRGEEVSVHAITDGSTLFLLPSAQDHKQIGEGDTGPNTGGMGAYSPTPLVAGPVMDKVVSSVFVPILHALRMERVEYRGVIFAGLMMTPGGPRVLEFNCRFGDPEAQVMLPRLKNDLGLVLKAAADGKLDDNDALRPSIDNQSCMGVVMASGGYPSNYRTGKVISGVETADAMDGVTVYHAGTRLRGDDLVTAGGRVLCVTASGEDLAEARDRAYRAVDAIEFDGAYARRDIGHRALGTTAS